MWEFIQPGEGVLLELPARWYAGIVQARHGITITLAPELCLCAHSLGDLGMFLEGQLSESSEISPLPRGIEIPLGSVETAQPYPKELLPKVCRRTHAKQKAK